jgi:hypothetical protein
MKTMASGTTMSLATLGGLRIVVALPDTPLSKREACRA